MRQCRSVSIGICGSELACLVLESIVILIIKLCDFGLQWVVSVRALHQSDQALNDKLRVQSGYPSVFNGLSADLTGILLYIGVENLGLKEYLRCLKGVVVAEVNVNNKLATLIRGVLGSKNSCVPVGQAVTDECNADTFYCLRHVQVI